VLIWLAKLYGFALLLAISAPLTLLFVNARHIVDITPETSDFKQWASEASSISRIYAADGTLLGDFAQERREFVPYDLIPPRLIDAVLAVEDRNFFKHHGLDYKGIARALWANVATGDFSQGGSTITQQVAKQDLGNEKSILRKAKEAVMARRLEARYSKKAILAVYLNRIFLGAGSYGVAAAARRYFQKDLAELTLAETALIAGLAQAPSAYSPLRNPQKAMDRRNVVLDQMLKYGFATTAEVAAARAEPVMVRPSRASFPERMPYYAEHVRIDIEKRFGKGALGSDGLWVETAVEPGFDAAAYDSADFGSRHQDKRQGWRGPEWHVEGAARDLLIERQRQRYGAGALSPGRRYLALVEKVRGDGLSLRIGDGRYELPLRNMSWASPWKSGNADNDIPITSTSQAVKVGDVIWVAREIRSRGRFRDWNMPDAHNPAWRPAQDESSWDQAHASTVVLEQVPHPQSAIFTADHHTGYVLAMVGGHDHDRSVYNRAVQACRQPGSTYKPIYYSLGLDAGYGFDTILNDVPVKIVDPETGIEWTPTNLNDTLDGDVTLEYALVFSKNIPSVDLFRRLGADKVERWARTLGFTSKIIADDALALGASCTYLDEMARAFAVFARDGRWFPRPPGSEKDWIYVRRVRDRRGNALIDHRVIADPAMAPADVFDRIAAAAGREAPQAIAPRTAYLTNKLLAQMVTYGFTRTLRNTELHAAGKTGTSSDTHDNSFIAYTSRHVTAVWLGDDQKQRALGRKDAAYMTVVPLWARYMYDAARGFPNPPIPWNLPFGVSPRDRGSHSKGTSGPPMELIYRHAGPTDPASAPPA
jgi:penicillin-binding protein 1A